ncbi:hypothetical protein [Variovorax rhizosphaerae]|uniref:Integrase n=1 Tax=Variovorax rhizosphaerae TaxID=1836200 RepID=A0ABU8WHL4_9BURK
MDLAVERNVAASTHNLYKNVFGAVLPWLDEAVQARTLKRLPVMLMQREVRDQLDELNGPMWLRVSLQYGTGMRLLE